MRRFITSTLERYAAVIIWLLRELSDSPHVPSWWGNEVQNGCVEKQTFVLEVMGCCSGARNPQKRNFCWFISFLLAPRPLPGPTKIIRALVKRCSFRETAELPAAIISPPLPGFPSPNLSTWTNTDTDTHTLPIKTPVQSSHQKLCVRFTAAESLERSGHPRRLRFRSLVGVFIHPWTLCCGQWNKRRKQTETICWCLDPAAL